MHAAVQSGGRSPKRLNGPSSTQQLKSGSDNVQSNASSFACQMKGKKRDRVDQIMEPNKRERTSKVDDGDSSAFKFENNMIKSELSKITEKGALVTTDGVEKLVQLMLVDNSKKVDLTGRVLFADVIAATERTDCLNKFVQIRGVRVLHEWLQEAHKGKAGDGSSPKESDKAVEELLLALLRALDRLPINLNALQTCNIGKSVNHLRGHKNLEIQKKARSLVDTWKKRVDAEMKTNDTKPIGSGQAVTWPVKTGFSDVSHVANRRSGSGESSMKSSITQQAAWKGLTGKSVHGDAVLKSTTVVVGTGKMQSPVAAVGISSKDSPSRVALDVPQVLAKEEKSSSSSQSQNNSQSCSSDHGKTVGSSLKEDARSSTAVSVNANKSSGSSRHRRSNNGFVPSTFSVGQKDSNSSKPGFHNRNLMPEKLLQAGISCEKTIDVPSSDHGIGHRLVVRLPNPGRSPVRTSSGGFFEDPSAGSRASSPVVLDKQDHGERKVIGMNDTGRTHIAADVNAESWQSNDVKESLCGSDEGGRSPTVVPDEERKAADDAMMVAEISRTACSSSSHDKVATAFEPNRRKSFTSMNALIESCAKYSEATSLSGGDDNGMKLLASVATGEISKKDVVSPTPSSGGSPVAEDPSSGANEANSMILAAKSSTGNLGPTSEIADSDYMKHGKENILLLEKDGVREVVLDFPGDNKTGTLMMEDKFQQSGLHPDFKHGSDREAHQNQGEKRIDGEVGMDFTSCKSESSCPFDEVRITISANEKITERNEDAKIDALADHKPYSVAESGIEVTDRKADDSSSSVSDKVPCPESADLWKCSRFDGSDDQSNDHGDNESKENTERNGSPILPPSSKVLAEFASSQPLTANRTETIERKSSLEKHGSGMVDTINVDAGTCAKTSATDGERKEEIASSAEVSLFNTIVERDAGTNMLDFDLNEGILGDELNQSGPISPAMHVCSSAMRMSKLSPIVVPTINGASTFVTVAAPAKGPFIHPENLLKCKGELGWKGSAATSAFRPAEPRKVLEIPFNSCDVHSLDNGLSKQSRLPLEIDLNVPDDRALEDMTSQSSVQTTCSESGVISNNVEPLRSAGGLDLDLNLVDEGTENGHLFATTSRRLEVPLVLARSATDVFQDGEANIFRNFDLNNGPSVDDVGADSIPKSQITKISNNMPFVPPAGVGLSNANLGGGWFPPGNSYPAVAIPSFLPDRGEHSYPIIAAARSVTGAGAFGSEIYRPVLSSSPAMTFSPAAAAFSYAGGFPFGATFPLASTSFSVGSTNYVDSSSVGGPYIPPIPSPLVPAGGVSSPFARPYVLTLAEGSGACVSESGRKWGRQALDLNTGPGIAEEFKDDRLLSSRHLHASNSQSLMEDQARLYQVTGGLLKKEPDGGWESERFTFKHPPWQ
ncbi:hypothetical protein HPP92_010523 [Vanilla planifolia]|uniref:TFIIS N-terminal domain-containing protein n=1 Tax=Vanilla planifolia TaxID=51239 RepID=A0A835V0X7_VANPL|nr:hypothetical protein HPP92_010523 [Vanilla planifolia]